MSLNWVMLDQKTSSQLGFASPVPLPDEEFVYKTVVSNRLSMVLESISSGNTISSSSVSSFKSILSSMWSGTEGGSDAGTDSSSSSTSPSVSTPNCSHPVKIESGVGRLFVSTRRIVYIPKTSFSFETRVFVPSSNDGSNSGSNGGNYRKLTRTFESLSIPLSNIHVSQIYQPWFGPNGWDCVFTSVAGGGMDELMQLPLNHRTQNSNPNNNVPIAWKLRLIFLDGGAFEFLQAFSRLYDARAMGVNHIEDLPRYESVPVSSLPGVLEPSQLANTNHYNQHWSSGDNLPNDLGFEGTLTGSQPSGTHNCNDDSNNFNNNNNGAHSPPPYM
ncbi:hypothetical protein NADFUDRAFT_48818 [Nadsonia fulvescens var. elongata DSM 6958]|uniref:Uncharacterized protein n=1 Tax=Nadsonia fulvescens var. elongata DSM 6958 TaxID=857566 RepID=A0A1E3PSB2_9ASCO|nr:hypothetical protein NADFUDRAFT_48818 [Nadsonia fulvescens var. elongata DSM 6958]